MSSSNCKKKKKRKAKTFYQSAGLQLPLEGKRFFDLFGFSIKTEEDLVK
ncbi:hypothetical protein HMPREF1153_2189 [Selenomonas sp. CM52]|nr:hypothetical protein HMPREF1153_2189 [Selenomonas sp. CM52]